MGWSLWERIRTHARDDGDRPAFVEQATARRLPYGQLVDAVGRIESGPPVELLTFGNQIEFVIRFVAALSQGRDVLPIDRTAPPAEVNRLKQLAEAEMRRGDGSVLLATSGTTGAPKLVRRDRERLADVGGAMVDAIGHAPADRVLAAVPLSHSYGMEHGLLAPLFAGCTAWLCDGLDLPSVAAAWQAGATVFPAVPSMLELMLRADLPRNESLRRVYTAGAPLPPAVAEAFENRYGVAVGQVFGSTEVGSATYRDPARDAPGTVGRAVRNVRLRISEHGELFVAPLHGQFVPTGDLARLSAAGELTLLGRRELLIDIGGQKVNPLEVEAVLAEHPGVAACVVLPLVLSETIRKVRAIVVPIDPAAPPSATALRHFLRQQLARHKVPRLIEFRDTLPRTAAGKIARQLLETP